MNVAMFATLKGAVVGDARKDDIRKGYIANGNT